MKLGVKECLAFISQSTPTGRTRAALCYQEMIIMFFSNYATCHSYIGQDLQKSSIAKKALITLLNIQLSFLEPLEYDSEMFEKLRNETHIQIELPTSQCYIVRAYIVE
jgi:hypothetical protein